MNLIFVSAEVSPWSKTGGLGDVVGGLPVELAKMGHNVMTIAPRYDQYRDGWDTSVVVEISGEKVRFFHTKKQGVERVFVDHPVFLSKVWGKTGSKLYGKKTGADFKDNQQRFRLFCEAAIEAARVLPFGPGEDCTFIANDWHSGLVPVLIKDIYQPKGEFVNAKVLFCLHNIAFQGRFWAESFKDLNLPQSSLEKFEFEDGYPYVYDEDYPVEEYQHKQPKTKKMYKKINWMKAAFLSADKILTVSPNYAHEITSDEELGVELNGVILEAGGVEGIVNGMELTEWSPDKDKFLDVKYDKETVTEGKANAKELLQAELGLPIAPDVPLIGFVGRLEEQKGVDILLEALPGILDEEVQIALLGTGKKKFEKKVKALETQFPDMAKGIVKFSPRLAHLITAGSDFMLVPSRFEPCGLTQLHAMQYGTVPIVASTGGLVDTVKEKLTGFLIDTNLDLEEVLPEDVDAVVGTVTRAVNVYKSGNFAKIVQNCIEQDLSWKKPAKKWEAVLEEVLEDGKADAVEKKASVKTPAAEVVMAGKQQI